ncbi:casein kinase II beta chain, partial [Reticulomyxa filosa]
IKSALGFVTISCDYSSTVRHTLINEPGFTKGIVDILGEYETVFAKFPQLLSRVLFCLFIHLFVCLFLFGNMLDLAFGFGADVTADRNGREICAQESFRLSGIHTSRCPRSGAWRRRLSSSTADSEICVATTCLEACHQTSKCKGLRKITEEKKKEEEEEEEEEKEEEEEEEQEEDDENNESDEDEDEDEDKDEEIGNNRGIDDRDDATRNEPKESKASWTRTCWQYDCWGQAFQLITEELWQSWRPAEKTNNADDKNDDDDDDDASDTDDLNADNDIQHLLIENGHKDELFTRWLEFMTDSPLLNTYLIRNRNSLVPPFFFFKKKKFKLGGVYGTDFCDYFQSLRVHLSHLKSSIASKRSTLVRKAQLIPFKRLFEPNELNPPTFNDAYFRNFAQTIIQFNL